MRSDIDTIEQEIKERVALVEKLPVVPSVRLSGDWSCTGTRKGLAGCPSITVSPVTTTMTWSIVKDFFGIQGMAKRTTLVLTTFEDVETMHAEYPLVTGLSENGPDVDQVADNASTYRYVGGCAMCH
ncbi:uncharacterized protein HMPREF1541_08926 [Cyphellophora europaea CBS 101466]|uniref:Uncharacterized protein n=1 Tax=Cyphellophora europaea (strain CBS 101466) TaxID=1220924 RepID=W2RLR1_CYPE1|nr:uncharacterized protein HMPREF1541_08926 [Cyphellophora europaea CBS 101466]ETN36648.1 hypothetical protein HMPREF1541_08926 [Cyphellophora europaea CBS 101466]